MPGSGSGFPVGKRNFAEPVSPDHPLQWHICCLSEGFLKTLFKYHQKNLTPISFHFSLQPDNTLVLSRERKRVAISMKNLTHLCVGKYNPSLNKYLFSTALTHSWRQHLDLETNSPCHLRDILCVFGYKRPTNGGLSMPERLLEQSVACKRVFLPGAQWFGGFYTFVSDFCICGLVGQITLLEPSSMTKYNTNFLASLFWHSWKFTSNKAAVKASTWAALKWRPGRGSAVRAEVWE